MRATVNGVMVEGSPEEVWAYVQKSAATGTNIKPYKPFNTDWVQSLSRASSALQQMNDRLNTIITNKNR